MVKQPTAGQKTQAYQKAEATVEKAVGRNPTLATMSNYFRTQIPIRGVPKVRSDVMRAIDTDIQAVIKKHTEPEPARKELHEMLETALKTPEYAKLLDEVDLGEEHAKIMIREAIDKKWIPITSELTQPDQQLRLAVTTVANAVDYVAPRSWWRRVVDMMWRTR